MMPMTQDARTRPTIDSPRPTFSCRMCGAGNRVPGTTTITLTPGGAVLVFQQVPADVCEICGDDAVLTEATSRRLEQLALAAVDAGVTMQVSTYQER